jgi:hypothetical protein
MTASRSVVTAVAVAIAVAVLGGTAAAQPRLGLCAGDDAPGPVTAPATPVPPGRSLSDGLRSAPGAQSLAPAPHRVSEPAAAPSPPGAETGK